MTEGRSPPDGLASIRELNYTVLLCRDVDAMTAFYRDVMAFPVIEARPSWVVFKIGGTVLALRPRGRAYDGDGSPPGNASVHLAFQVAPAQIDICHRELIDKGVPIVSPPAVRSWGHRTLFFTDPEQNVLEIYAEL